jgi:hypothetical protein
VRAGPEGIASQFACPLAKPGKLTSKTMTARAVQAVIPPSRRPHGRAVVFSNNGIVAKSRCARISSAASRNAGICFDGPASRLRLRPCRSICRCNSRPCLHMTIPVPQRVSRERCRCLKGRSRKKSAVSWSKLPGKGAGRPDPSRSTGPNPATDVYLASSLARSRKSSSSALSRAAGSGIIGRSLLGGRPCCTC